MARRTKTNRSPEFKAKVALAALQDGKTVQQLATLFDVHPTQVQTWKKQLLVGAAEVFQAGVVTDDKLAQDAKEGELLKEIGRLTVELNWLKKKCPASVEVRRGLIEPGHSDVSVQRQCELLGLPRSTHYYRPAVETAANLEVMRWIDAQYLETPYYGSRRMEAALNAEGFGVNRKRVQRLMRVMGLEGLQPKRATTTRGEGHRIFPYLLRNVVISHPDQVWSADITYLPLRGGFVYLTAVMDWYSRYVLSWQLSNRLEGSFCLEALDVALTRQPVPPARLHEGRKWMVEDFDLTASYGYCRDGMLTLREWVRSLRGVHESAAGPSGGREHGWPGPRVGQRVHRAAVEECEIRRHLSQGLCDGGRSVRRAGRVLREVQPRASSPGVGLLDAGKGLRVGRRGAIAAAGGADGLIHGERSQPSSAASTGSSSAAVVVAALLRPPLRRTPSTWILGSCFTTRREPANGPGVSQ